MKKLLPILLTLTLCTAPCHAQFGTLKGILKGAKTINDARKAQKKAQEAWGNTKVNDIHRNVTIDTTSVEYKNTVAEAQQRFYDKNPELKKLMEMQGDTVALKKYYEEKYGGMSQEEKYGGMSQEEKKRKMLEEAGFDYDSEEFQDAYAKAQKMSGLKDDSVYKSIMEEQRRPTMQEAIYLKETYGMNVEYEGMEAYNDSVGVFANLNGKMIPMSITIPESITEEKPVPDFGLDAIKQYVQEYRSFLKKPIADREIVDSVQNYMIYNHRHADEQFKGTAKFTLYSNLETDIMKLAKNEMYMRKIAEFSDPIDPKNIFVFKVHKGYGCRYMEYMYSKISYKQSELSDYISKRLVNGGYIDANINQKMSDEEMFKAIDKIEFQFKVEKLLKIRKNNEKFMYKNTIPAAEGVNITSNVRKVGGHITALDIAIEAEPGEYAFIIRDPEVEEFFKEDNQDFDISILEQGAFFFTIK